MIANAIWCSGFVLCVGGALMDWGWYGVGVSTSGTLLIIGSGIYQGLWS